MKQHAAAAALVVLASPLLVAQQPSAGAYQVSGRVVMGDGAPVPSATAVELICNGRIRRRATTFSSGDFTLTLDDDTHSTDVTTPRGPTGPSAPFSGLATQPSGGEDLGRFEMSGCELRAALPGYQSNLIALGPRRRLDKPFVGQLVLRRTTDPDGPVLTANTRAAPPQAKTALDEAWNELQKPKPDHRRAIRGLEAAIKIYPAFAAAWHVLGTTRLALKDATGARQAFNESIAADPSYVEPYIELATMEAQLQHWPEAAVLIAHVQELNPYIPYANYLSASVHFQSGQMDVAERSAMAVHDTPDLERYPFVYYILGAIQARRGDYATASARFRQYLHTKPDPGIAETVEQMLKDWEQEGRLKARTP